MPKRIAIIQACLPTFLLAFLVAGTLPLAGCIAPFGLPEERPIDYALLVTVYPADPPPADPAFRAARYAIEPDGLLRAEVGNGVTRMGFPPIAQRLEPAQIDQIYALTRESGVNDSAAQRIPGPTVYQPTTDEPVIVIEIGSKGRFQAFQLPADPQGSAGPLIRELARLSWTDR